MLKVILMYILEIFFGLWWLWLPGILIWLYVRNKNNKTSSATESNESNNNQWLNYIGSFSDVVKSKAEKHLINTLLAGKSADQLYAKNPEKTVALDNRTPITSETTTFEQITPATNTEPTESAPKTSLDNTLVLLYFGAFLLVASAGLFVALSDVTPLLRTVLVAITAGLLYIGGLWIYQTKQKLAQAGLSFIGTGMVIAPLTGVAWYNLIAHQNSGAIIWFITSILCLGLYTHAFLAVKNNLMPYLMIGSLVSTIESLVLVGSMPNYIFAWVAIVLGLIFQLTRSFSSRQPYFNEAQDNSAQILVPLSIFGSLILAPNYGSTQLAVTLILSGIYYASLAFRLKTESKELYSPTAQLALISGFSNIVYGQTESFRSVMVFLAGVSLVYILGILILKLQKVNENSLALIGGLTVFIATALSVNNSVDFTIYLFEAFLMAFVYWLRTTNTSVLLAGGLILIALPFSVGQYALKDKLNAELQTIFGFVPFMAFYALSLLSYKKQGFKDQQMTSNSLVLLSATALIGTSMASGFVTVTIVSCLILAGLTALQYITKDTKWWSVASVVITAPFFYAIMVKGFSTPEFTIATAIMLGVNTTISLITREELVRWILTGGILIAPVALGAGGLGFKWHETGYSICYLVSMVSLVFARSIARGKLLVNKNVALSSYDKSSSLGFSAGYLLAGIIAVGSSLSSPNAQLLTTVVLGVVTLVISLTFYYIENETKALMIIPFLVQLTIFSAIRPNFDEALPIALTAITLSAVSALTYFMIDLVKSFDENDRLILLSASLISSFLGPAMVIFGPKVHVLFPISLTIAGGLSYYHSRNQSQGAKELSVALVAVSIHWILYLSGVKNVHIHTHIAMLLLGGFSWWRASKSDYESSQNYLKSAYLIATVPMIIQALSGSSGGTYGLILIIQQASFMALGALSNQKFLLKAGLWVALASVLYQLRGLGWAFLTIVAVILIGFAVYRLQKHDDNSNKS